MRVGLLGSLEIADDGRRVDVGGSRLRALVVRLALDAGRTVSTAALLDAVWEEDRPAGEVHALQSLVSRLRRSLGDAALVAQTPGGYRLAVDPGAVDAHRFERLAREGAAALRDGDLDQAGTVLRDALALWRGPALQGVAGERRFATAAADRLDDLRLAATVDRVEADLARGGASAGLVAEIERLAADHPLDERVARQLVRALAAAGRQADALAAYERVRAALSDELGAAPAAELQAAHLAVLRGERDVPAPAAARPRRAGARTNLRAPLTSFVGREPEIERVDAALERHRLVTLIGPGGAGKTRLAEEAGGRWVARVPDGVWLVELAPVTEAAEIVPALLGSLRLREAVLLEPATATVAPADAMYRVLDVLGDRTALVVLDNCEHLIAATARVTDELLGRCPGVRILATSREPLGIVGERLVDVPPLAWPEAAGGAEQALVHPAVELFADRAAAASPGFGVDDRNVAAVVEICRRLDGLPLAIELAAARLRTLSPEQLAQRLDDRFRLLTGGSRTAMPRHRTLRAVVDWSWDLLTEPERALAARLAVLAGGVTPQSAAAVCADVSGLVAPADVLDLLAALVDRSLLQVVDADGPRYRMLETIREYGLDRLRESGDLARVRTAHARWFAELVEAQEPRLRTAGQLAAFGLLTAERENILAALRHLADTGDAARALRLAVSLLWFAVLAGGTTDAVAWIRMALEAEGDADPSDRAIAETIVRVTALGGLDPGPDEDDPGRLERELVADVAALLDTADTTRRPIAAFIRPVLSWLAGDRDRAEELLAEARAHPDPWVRAAAPLMRAQLAENDGDIERTRGELERALDLFRALGDRWGLAMTLLSQAGVWMLDGELDAAAVALDEARALTAELGGRSQDAMLELRLAEVRLRRGDAAGARSHLDRLEDLHDLSGEELLIVDAMRSRVAWAAGQHDAARALRGELVAVLEGPHGGPPGRGHARAIAQTSVGFLWLEDDELDAAHDALCAAHLAAAASHDMPIVATVGLVVAGLAERRGRPIDAAEMMGAAARLRGAEDATNCEVAELTGRLRAALGDDGFEAAYARGRETARDAAIARLHPASRSLEAPAVRP